MESQFLARPSRANEIRGKSKKLQCCTGTSSYEPSNQAGSVTGTNFVVCSYGKFQLGDRDEIQETKPKWRHMDNHSFVDSCNFSNKVTSITFEVEMQLSQNYAILAALLRKQSQFSQQGLPGNRAGVFIWENFHPGCRDLGNRAGPPSHMNTSKFLQRK